MANVVILKQPLYGSVIWNGIEFEYTPNTNFSGNDTYTYKITDINGTRVITNYVNPTNLQPTAKNITVNALANDLTEVDISVLVDDATNPFNYLTITEIKSNIVMGSVKTDGVKIYFTAGYFNSTEYVDYTVSDKQYESSGRITFNVTGGINPQDYKGSPYFRFGVLLNKLNGIKPLSSKWASMYNVLTSRGPIWDTIDANRYNAMANTVSSSDVNANFIKWNSSFLNVNKFNIMNSTITGNSATWENYRILGNNTYDLIDNSIKSWNSVYNTLLVKNPIWSFNIYTINALSSKLVKLDVDMTSVSTTVTNNANIIWDSTELYNISANYFESWNDLVYQIITNNNDDNWDNSSNDFSVISSDYINASNNISNTYTTVVDNSGYWKVSDINTFSAANFENWNNTYNTLTTYNTNWDNTSNDFSIISSDYINASNNISNTHTTVVDNSGYWKVSDINTFSAANFENWNNTYNTLTTYNTNWDNNNTNISTFSAIYIDKTKNFNNTYNTFQDNSSNWNVTVLSSFSANNFENWNQLYIIISLSSNLWYDLDRESFITNYNNKTSFYKSTYSTVQSKSSNWGHTGYDTYSANNFYKWDSVYNTVNNNINIWGNFTYNDLTSFSAAYYSDTTNYTSTSSTVNSTSGKWGHTSFDTYSANNFPKWDVSVNKISNVGDLTNSISTFSASYYNNSIWLQDLYLTTFDKSSSDWSLTFVSAISNNIQKYDDSYDIIIATSDNTNKWNETYNSVNTFNTEYLNVTPKFKSTSITVNNNVIFWNDTSASTILTQKSGNWDSTYTNVNNLSSTWFFNQTSIPLNNVLNSVTANSAIWNAAKQKIDNSNTKWNNTYNSITSISSNALTGSNTITLSTKDLFVYGNTNIKGNLSALGKRIKINTSLYTISGFEITNNGTTFALNVAKNGGFDKAIVNFDTLSSTILYVKTNNAVGINLSSFPSTNALTVSGNISATGAIYPLDPIVSTFVQNSAKYTSTYTYITSISSSFYSVCALSANYNSLANYISLSSNNLTNIKNNKIYYDLMTNYTQSNSGYNSTTNNYVAANSASFGVDSQFRNNQSKYDNLYSAVTTISSSDQIYNINILFSYPLIVNSKKINYVVQDNIKINSWTMISDVPTIAEILILSATQNNYPTMVDITNGVNKPHLDLTNADGKNYNNNLIYWKGTNISANSILQFNMTNNNAASSIMISLNVNKI